MTVSIIIHVILVVVLVLIPLLFLKLSGSMQQLTALVAPPPRLLRLRLRSGSCYQSGKGVDDGTFRAPVEIPKDIKMVVDEGPPPETAVGGVVGGVPGGVPGGQIGGVIGGVIGGAPSAVAPPPPPPPPAAPKPPQRVKVGGNVQQANLIRQVKPPYPPLAKQARIQGTVILEAIISKQGSVEQLKVVSGHPLLVQAAMDAVRQWKYSRTPEWRACEVVTQVTLIQFEWLIEGLLSGL
jgi:protein TonB